MTDSELIEAADELYQMSEEDPKRFTHWERFFLMQARNRQELSPLERGKILEILGERS